MNNLEGEAKELGQDHNLSLSLWKTSIAEARIIAAMVDEPEKLTEVQMVPVLISLVNVALYFKRKFFVEAPRLAFARNPDTLPTPART